MSNPALLQARFNQALALEGQNRFQEAYGLYLEILGQDPRNFAAADRVAAMFLTDNDFASALTWSERAIAINPLFPPACMNHGLALQGLGRLDEAIAAFTRAVTQAPEFAPAHYMLGRLLWWQGAYDDAVRHIEKAATLAPEFATEHEYDQLERLEQANWRGYEASVALTKRLTWAGTLAMNAVKFMYASDSAADHQQCARVNARLRYPARLPLWTGQKRREGKIRLGYLTSDFYDHAVAHIAAGYLEHHDRERFELTAFSCCPPYPSAIRDRVVAAFDHFENLAEADDAAVARLIRERDIDILVFLSGYAYRARPGVLAFRPAPVQVNFQGYPGTLGASYVDYLIADRHVVPPSDTGFYDEKIVWMPHTYQPTDNAVPRSGPTRTRAQEGLPERGVVFMAYHPAPKISPAIFGAWMRILTRTPGSVLWLQQASEQAAANLRGEAEARGVDPARLVFSERLTAREAHIARHALADLFIDSLPYNAHSTASDALWAGLPVVTCLGGAFPGRVCAGLLAAAGMPELAAENLAAYEEMVVALAHDPERLAAIRRRVREEAPHSPLFDTAAYTRDLEAAYQTMYERRQAGLPAAAFAVGTR